MSAKKPASANTPTTVVANDPDDRNGALKNIGGSKSITGTTCSPIRPCRRSGSRTPTPRRAIGN